VISKLLIYNYNLAPCISVKKAIDKTVETLRQEGHEVIEFDLAQIVESIQLYIELLLATDLVIINT
jgi:uroporphyrinogen-III synthase